MQEQKPISVLIVDDHSVVRQGISTFLGTAIDLRVIGAAGAGAEAVRLAAEFKPDVALVDLVMPGMDGVETTLGIHAASPMTRVIIFTSFHEDEHIFPAIRAGALSYLTKDAAPSEIADAIRKAARGEAVLEPRVAARVVRELQGPGREAANLYTTLSERELEVLRLLAKGSTNQEISVKLVIGESTVKTHMSSILSKLHLTDRTQAAVYAWASGLVRRE